MSRGALLSKAGAAAVAAIAAGTLLYPREAKADHHPDDIIRVDYVETHYVDAQGAFVGRNPSGAGVRGEGSNQAEVAGVRGLGKTGVWGSSEVTGYSGVYGQHTGSAGYGVVGDGKGSSAGVLGRNPQGDGVRGEADGDGASGVKGTSQKGYGGTFWGDKGNLLLGLHVGSGPPGSPGVPTSPGVYKPGTLYIDINANLFVCTERGNPGTWRQIRTVAV